MTGTAPPGDARATADFFAIPSGAGKESPSREAEYMRKATEKLYAERERRLSVLQEAVTKDAINRATQRLTALAHPNRDYIVIRSEFIYRLPARPAWDAEVGEDISTRPPLTRLLKSKNQHAIALYLTKLFVEQMRAAHSAANNPTPPPEPLRRHSVYNIDNAPSEASLIGLPSIDRRNQRRVFNRALDALHKCELVDLGDTGHRYTNHTLNREDGSGRRYRPPTGEPNHIKHLCLPAEFFTTGWHLILTPSELATLLAVCHVADRKLSRAPHTDAQPRQIFLAESVRKKHLGLSAEAYECIHQLAEFGLIGTDDTVQGRRRGRISPDMTGGRRPDPYKLTPTVLGGFPSDQRGFDRDMFKEPAIDLAIDRLRWPITRYAIWAGTSRKKDAESSQPG
ncbi:hypothetical protein NWT09_31495 [Mycolicibacterium sp. jd]|uniref:hypothetical protein n=1 Tax=unclassified Mycolicibacterium TaxID=2636767 RepID=UPI00351B308B